MLHVVTRHLKEGGAARDVDIAIQWQVDNGYRVHLVVGHDSDPGPLPEAVTVEFVDGLTRSVRPTHDVRAFRAIARIIRSFRPDLVQTHQSKAGVLGRLAARGSGAVVLHTVHMASFGRGYSGPASYLFKTAERVCARFTDYYVTVSQELADEYLAAGIGSPPQFTVIPTPIDVSMFADTRSFGEERRRSIRARWSLPEGIPVLFGCGLLEKRKRWDVFLRGVAPLLRSREAVAVIAGTGPEDASLRELGQQLGVTDQLLMPGYTDDIADLFAIASVVILTSATEGLPRVLLEGLAAGVPLVATDVQGARELAAHGLVILPANGDGLGDACRRLIARPGAPADLGVLREWTVSAVQQRLANLHRDVNLPSAS